MTSLFRLLTAATVVGASAAPIQAQSSATKTVSFPVAPVPFGPGEVMNYRVDWGVFGTVGEGRMEVGSIDTVDGHSTYHISFKLKGGIPLARVDDLLQSWLDVSSLVSRRFEQNQHEVKYKRHFITSFFPEEMRWQREDNKNEKGELPTAEPLDDVSFLYFARTLPLEVGQSYTFNRYFKADGNPVIIKVLRKDTLKIGKQVYPTIVVQPIIRTRNALFAEGGEAEVHFSDDERRLIVYLRVKLSIATAKFYLLNYTPGAQLVTGTPSGGSGATR